MSYNLKQNADGSMELQDSYSADSAFKCMPVPQMDAGTGITAGTGTIYRSSVAKVGGIIQTKILIDLTGLDSDATLGDIIGKSGKIGRAHV